MVTKASNTVFNIKQVPASFAQANAAFTSANNVAPQVQPSFDKANAAYLHANAAFNSANNVAPQVQPAFDKANAAFAAANSVNVYDANTNSTGFFALPQGTTAQRPASPANGSIRFNTTTGAGEMYFSSNGWVTFAGEPVITDVTPTTFNGTSGTAFNIYGYRLSPDAQIFFLSSNGASYLAGSVSYFSPTLIVATTPKNFTVAEEPLSVKIVQGSGTYIKSNVIDCGGVPSWITTAGGLGSIFGVNTVNVYVSASDPEGNAITYSIRSGSLPGGLSLRSANGLIQGLANSVLTNTTYNFTITASDSVNETDRAFSYIVLNRVPVFNTASSLSNITDSMLDNYSANVTVNAYDPDGGSITYSLAAGSVPTGFTFNTSNGALQMTNANTAEVTTNTTSTFTVSATDQGNDSETRQFTLVVEPPIDADFPNTVLLLSATDSNTVLKDASSNNLNIIPFADAKASNFSPYNTSWSNVFDGSGDYLTTASYPGLNLNLNNNWTVEGWFYRTGSLGNQSTFASLGAGGSNVYWTFSVGETNGVVGFGAGAGNWNFTSTAQSSTGVINLNRWYHVAWVRNGATTLSMYVNGVQVYNNTSFNFGSATQGGTLHLGTYYANYNNDGSWYSGYISNFRIVNGTSIYTSAFTPPTSPLSNVANTVLLTSHTNRFHNEANSLTSFVRNGDVKVVGWSPFAETDTTTGSVYLDGTGDYVSWTPRESFGSSDFTAETWFYITNPSSGGLDLFSLNANEGGSIASARLVVNANSLYMLASTSGSGWEINAQNLSPTIPSHQWNHVSLNRVGSSWSIYLNGIKTGATQTLAGSLYNGNKSSIGYNNFSPSPIHTPGYFSDFRLTIGNAVYTANTTVPTSPLSNTANTKVLTLQNRQPHNNHGFQDKSNNKFLITRNGNSTQGTFTPFSSEAGKWSIYFNGNQNYIAPSQTAVGTGDFTMECWAYPTAFTNFAALVNLCTNSTQYGPIINLDQSGYVQGRIINGTATSGSTITSSSALTLNKWYHIALVRSSGTMTLYINGVAAAASVTNTTNCTGTLGCIGAQYPDYSASGRGFIGYISNARVIRGQSLYSGTFTPSVFPLTTTSVGTSGSNVAASITGTVSFLVCGNNRFDSTFTFDGTPSIQSFTSFAPNASYSTANTGGSAYFDGSGDYLVVNSGSSYLPIGANDFTIELWWYPTAFQAGGAELFSAAYGDGTNRAFAIYSNGGNGGALGAYAGTGGSTWDIVSNLSIGTAILNQWNHIAFTRSGSTFATFLNGTRIATTTASGTLGSKNIGVGGAYGTGSIVPSSYISNPRVLVGTALYTGATYTVPTAPFNNIANTVVLLSFTDSAIVDYTGKNNLETIGDLKANNIIYKFNPGSYSSDGSGDYGKIPNNALYGFLTGDFTIEGWIRANSYVSGGSAYQTIFATSAFTGSGLGVKIQDAGGIATTGCINVWTGNSQIISGTSNVVDGNWHHFAISRSGTSLRLFVDGVLQTTVTNSTSFAAPSGIYPLIGSDDGTNGSFNGAISDLRVTRTARYTANFTPRPRKLPRR